MSGRMGFTEEERIVVRQAVKNRLDELNGAARASQEIKCRTCRERAVEETRRQIATLKKALTKMEA